MKFKNKTNGYTESASLSWLWTFLFGFLYFAVKGNWRHAVAYLILTICTFGVAWFIYPFFAPSIMRNHYARMGWVEAK